MSEQKQAQDPLKDQENLDDSSESEELEQAEQTVEKDIEQLLAEARKQSDEHWDSLLRMQADMENLRRRTRIDVENAHKYGVEKLINALVPVADSLELGLEAANKSEASLESIREGVNMTFKQLLDVLADFNVERIDPVGEKFNPQQHEAMTMVPSPNHEPNTVMEVFQKGYALNERLIRPARVIVSKEA
ncbi:MAG: nucleotide exchange factor GrpE [Thiomicrospira sp.]|uniref:nucleotide exchange factor GrpE n=1 Tax=Thiomicrospira sp. TaxID=935 RepID=UPI001A00AA3E|nr:nucleotide exchange factor GrpE [Thiomicrospira sp.]MBE0493713.1 nucleotide exchange factor GrpE [Thiomicrospira sp.]